MSRKKTRMFTRPEKEPSSQSSGPLRRPSTKTGSPSSQMSGPLGFSCMRSWPSDRCRTQVSEKREKTAPLDTLWTSFNIFLLLSVLHSSSFLSSVQPWPTTRWCSESRWATGCPAHPTVKRWFTTSWRTAGRTTSRSGPPLRHCSGSWRTTSTRTPPPTTTPVATSCC